jgi:hypothetical protein
VVVAVEVVQMLQTQGPVEVVAAVGIVRLPDKK